MRAFVMELSKLASLPAAWIAVAAGLIVPPGIATITSLTSTPGADTGYSELSVGVAGAIVLGVIAISSEYTTEGEESAGSRQISTTLTAVPSRIRVLAAKACAVAVSTALLAAAATAVTFGLTAILLGPDASVLDADHVLRMLGVLAYWGLTALLAFGLTVLTRNGIVPMALLIANASAVTVSFLLTRITPWANFLPDMAGLRMFSRDLDTGMEVAPVIGGLVMAAWVAALLIAAFIVFRRRDA